MSKPVSSFLFRTPDPTQGALHIAPPHPRTRLHEMKMRITDWVMGGSGSAVCEPFFASCRRDHACVRAVLQLPAVGDPFTSGATTTSRSLSFFAKIRQYVSRSAIRRLAVDNYVKMHPKLWGDQEVAPEKES